MNFFWPTRLNPVPRAPARLGRLLHYISVAAVIVGALLQYNERFAAPAWARPDTGQWLFGWAIVAVTYLAGRTARFLLAGE